MEVDAEPNGTISWKSLYTRIFDHACFDDPSSQLNLILYNVSHLPLLRRHLESGESLNLDMIKEAPWIRSSDSIHSDGGCYLVAVDSARPSAARSPLPNLTSVPESQLPSPVQFPKSTNALSSVQALRDLAAIRVRTDMQEANHQDCMDNNITIEGNSVHPEWVKSFVGHLSRRREITTAVSHLTVIPVAASLNRLTQLLDPRTTTTVICITLTLTVLDTGLTKMVFHQIVCRSAISWCF